MSLRIPRTFHYIWLGGKPLPEHFGVWMNGWKTINPGWELKEWNDTNLPDIINKKEFDAADKFAKKSDILRYELCYRYGGVYIDTDFEPLKPIESILSEVEAFVGEEFVSWPCNAILGSTSNDPFFKLLIDELPASVQSGGDIVHQTGPSFIKRCMQKVFDADVHGVLDPVSGVETRRYKLTSLDTKYRLHRFEPSVFYPYNYKEPEKEFNEFHDAYGKHHWTASWWKDGGV